MHKEQERKPGTSVLSTLRELANTISAEEGTLYRIAVGSWCWYHLRREWEEEGLDGPPRIADRYVDPLPGMNLDRSVMWEAAIGNAYRMGWIDFVSPAEVARRRVGAPFRDGEWIPGDDPEPQVLPPHRVP